MVGIIESQACGENNFTIKTLGLLAHRPDMRKRFAEKLTGRSLTDAPAMVFFSRVGENFMREWIEREGELPTGEMERRLSAAAELPDGFRWRRNSDGSLTQPAKWQRSHMEEMVADHLRRGAPESDRAQVQAHLEFLQDCLNTEPDLVMELEDRLIFVEIKVLSSEGMRQVERQMRLGRFMSSLMGLAPPEFVFLGPEWAARPSNDELRCVTWGQVAEWFENVPSICDTIRKTTFWYDRRACTMVQQFAPNTRQPFVARFPENKLAAANVVAAKSLVEQRVVAAPPALPTRAPKPTEPLEPPTDPWHFSHLDKKYFDKVIQGCRSNGIWPLKRFWLGTTGEAFAEIHNGRQINPNWMVEDARGRKFTRTGGFGKEHRYDTSNMRDWPFTELAHAFGYPTA